MDRKDDIYADSDYRASQQPDPSSDSAQEKSGQRFDTTVFAVDFSKGLKRFWYIVVIIAVVCAFLAASMKSKTYVPMYQSSVSFSVSTVSYSTNGSAVYASYYDNSSAGQLSKTFPYIVSTSMMRNALKNELGTEYINGSISAQAVASDSNIFKVTVSSSSPEDAYKIINAVIAVYPDVAQFVIGNIQLNILIKPTLPEEPYTTNNILRITAIAALIGAVIGFGIVAVYALFRNTVRRKEDFKSKLNQKCLVEVPYVVVHRKSKDKENGAKLIRITENRSIFKESFRLLRKRLLRHLRSDDKVLAVTSAASGEGKTTVAVNLAHIMALNGKKTAVVDMDRINRPLQKYFPQEKGVKCLSELIGSENADFGSAAVKDDENLYFFFLGKSDMTFSEASFAPFFDYLRSEFDYVIVNTSPGGSVSDVVSVCNMCDGLLFVVKQDTTSIDKIRKTLEYLSFSSAKILGFVFNGVKEGFSGYGGYYYGGKYGYGKYGYGKYGYGKYGYGKYGYGKYGYGNYGEYGHGYGYGYGEYEYGAEEESKSDSSKSKSKSHSHRSKSAAEIPDSEIPDNNSI